MFVGHTALALAAKRRAPELSLGWLLAATIALDLVWPIFLLLDLEQVAFGSATGGFDRLTFLSYPWSHSLLMSVLWGVVAFGIAKGCKVSTPSAALLGALVVSHWVLDFVTHAPDLPLWPGTSPHLGLGLWRSIPATFVVEGVLFAAGIWIYLSGTRAKDKIGSIGLWAFLLVQTVMWATSPWGAAPPSVAALGWIVLVAELVSVAWAGWADRHRTAT